MCPECGKPLVKKMGRFGAFVACSDYPKCKYKPPVQDAASTTEEDCPVCDVAKLVEKTGRFGPYVYVPCLRIQGKQKNKIAENHDWRALPGLP